MPRVVILDMQPITPPIGGGRLRLLGLYHGLGADIAATYVGTYDWPGEEPRDLMPTPTLREILVPLSKAHFIAASRCSQAVAGKTIIDSVFHTQVELSSAYLGRVREAIGSADVVIYSHPWLHPPTAHLLDRERQLVVYDSHNVEGMLRMRLLDDGGTGTEIVRDVVRIERNLCIAADLVLACSHDDASAFTRFYGISPGKTRVVPNGAFTERRGPIDETSRGEAKARLGLSAAPLVLFLGSFYQPNVEAARFVVDELAPSLPKLQFAVAGGVGRELRGRRSNNVIVTGELSEAEKDTWLDATDLAINPMFGGSGSNIKMLEFMAAGLPIVSTPIGARGIATSAPSFLVADHQGFAQSVASLIANPPARTRLAGAAVEQVRRHYSWEKISSHLGQMLTRGHRRLGRRPKFSVIVPTYQRHRLLRDVVDRLSAQRFRDFEVIIIDQSDTAWDGAGDDFEIDLFYVKTDVRGAVTARNTGAMLAFGEILAFTDDDTQPPPGWLEAAAVKFAADDIAGLEGLVVSDKCDDPAHRPVTNDGLEGIGFMTANLFVRSDVFQQIGGFDIGFENPHFREDTDLGWRIEKIGPVPFSREAWLYHPPHLRSIERESLRERSRFFVRDARLMRKHPTRYLELFLRERQWQYNPHFLRYFAEGLALESMTLPPEMQALFAELRLELPVVSLPLPA